MSKRNKKRNSKARFIRGAGQGTPSGASKPWHSRRFRVECRMDGTSHSTELRTRGIGGVI